METIKETKKTEKINYEKELKKKRDELTVKLVEMKPGTEEFNDTKNAIKEIDQILNEKSKRNWNIIHVGGLLLLTAAGLVFAHKDDIGDSLPAKHLGKFVGDLFNRSSKV